MAYFDRFDICEAYAVLEWDWNRGYGADLVYMTTEEMNRAVPSEAQPKAFSFPNKPCFHICVRGTL